MKYFGQYLVEKKLITQDVLVAALVEQVDKLPHASKIILEKSLLDSNSLLKIFEKQNQEKIDFRQACGKLNLWTPEVDSAVKKEIDTARIPLGHILISKNAITLPNLTKALDEFLSVDENITVPENNISTTEKAENQASVAIAQEVTFHPIDSGMIEEFEEFFSESRIGQFNSLLDEVLRNDLSEDKIEPLCKEVHTLKGMAVCVRIPVTTNILEKIEFLFEKIKNSPSSFEQKKDEIKSTMALSVELISSLRNRILAEGNEENFFKENGKSIGELTSSLEKLAA